MKANAASILFSLQKKRQVDGAIDLFVRRRRKKQLGLTAGVPRSQRHQWGLLLAVAGLGGLVAVSHAAGERGGNMCKHGLDSECCYHSGLPGWPNPDSFLHPHHSVQVCHEQVAHLVVPELPAMLAHHAQLTHL